MARTRWTIGNWKQNLLRGAAEDLATAVVGDLPEPVAEGGKQVRVGIAPSYVALDAVRPWVRPQGPLFLFAQDVAGQDEGAFTGEVGPAMLQDAGVHGAIVGHSERRLHYGETDESVARKVQVALEAGHDLSRLLQGALQQPEAFRSVPAVFQRPLVPTARGRALSLDDTRALAGKGQLYRTRGGSDLARRAVAGGAHVLEDSVPEARAVADALGAIDLDPWDRLLAGARETPLLTAVNAALRGADERLHVIAAAGLGEEVRSLDLQPLRLRGSPWHGRRVVALAADNPWMRDAAAAMTDRPRAAVFAALDYIADRLDLPAERRALLLHAAARAAVHEAAT